MEPESQATPSTAPADQAELSALETALGHAEQIVTEKAESEAKVADLEKQLAAAGAKTAAAVDAWISKEIQNSPVARNTPAWNHLQAKLPALKQMLAQAIGA